MLNSMLMVILLGFLLTLAPDINAQDTSTFEPISPDNILDLEAIMMWEAADNGFVTGTFSHAGDHLAISLNDGTIQLLNAETFATEQTFLGVAIDGTQLTFSEDDSRLLLSSFWDGSFQLWDVVSGEILLTSETIQANDWSAFDAQFQQVATVREGTLVILEIDSGEEFVPDISIQSDSNPVWSADGSYVLISQNDTVNLVEIASGESLYEFASPIGGNLNGYGFDPETTLFWASWQDWETSREENPSLIQFWSVSDGTEYSRLEGQGNRYGRVYFDATGQRVALIGQNTGLTDVAVIWDLQKGEFIREVDTTGGALLSSFNPTGELFALHGGTSRMFTIAEVENAAFGARAYFDVGNGPNTYPTFSPDGYFLLTATGNALRLWAVPVTDG